MLDQRDRCVNVGDDSERQLKATLPWEGGEGRGGEEIALDLVLLTSVAAEDGRKAHPGKDRQLVGNKT